LLTAFEQHGIKAGIQPGAALRSSSTDLQDSSLSHESERSSATHLARHHGLVITWMRCYWDEGDTWFYFEVDAEG